MTIIKPSHHPTWIDDPAWQTVESGLDHGALVDLSEPGYPLPAGCVHQWRAFTCDNDYGKRIVVLQALKATTPQPPLTRTEMNKIVLDLMANDAADYPADVRGALDRLGEVAGTGTPHPKLASHAERSGPDYICAANDGSVLVWGEDRVFHMNHKRLDVRAVYMTTANDS